MDTHLTALTFAATALASYGLWLRTRYRHEFLVQEGTAGLLFHEGRLLTALPAGRHVRWGRHYHVAAVETRRTLLPVPGQEVLTADHVSVKLSAVLTLQTVDALRQARTAASGTALLYSAVQTALRTVVARYSLEALLQERTALGAQVRELVAAEAETLGLQVFAAEVRDVMLPGELRKAFAETLKARQEGQAALERARGESAALRHLANAARLLESQPALATLRFLQTLEASGSNSTVVLNDLTKFLPAWRASSAAQETT